MASKEGTRESERLTCGTGARFARLGSEVCDGRRERVERKLPSSRSDGSWLKSPALFGPATRESAKLLTGADATAFRIRLHTRSLASQWSRPSTHCSSSSSGDAQAHQIPDTWPGPTTRQPCGCGTHSQTAWNSLVDLAPESRSMWQDHSSVRPSWPKCVQVLGSPERFSLQRKRDGSSWLAAGSERKLPTVDACDRECQYRGVRPGSL